MNIKDLTHDQQVCLVALTEAVTIADGNVSEGEQEEISELATELGTEHYRELLNEAEKRLSDITSLKTFAEGITDQQARELIYGKVMEDTLAEPSVYHSTSDLMAWLADCWDIKVELRPDEDSSVT